MHGGAARAAQPHGEIGGVEEDRTPDLRIANATLSQLSYHPIGEPRILPEGGGPGYHRGSPASR